MASMVASSRGKATGALMGTPPRLGIVKEVEINKSLVFAAGLDHVVPIIAMESGWGTYLGGDVPCSSTDLRVSASTPVHPAQGSVPGESPNPASPRREARTMLDSRAPRLASQRHCQLNRIPLYSPSMAWHTHPLHAAHRETRALSSSPMDCSGSCHGHRRTTQPIQTPPLSL